MRSNPTVIKPFLKWAGGKTQLIKEIDKQIPSYDGHIKKYAEPFVGGGAIMFHILSNYDVDEVYISDINDKLINAYKMIRDSLEPLVAVLSNMQEEYLAYDDLGRKTYYLSKRERFNELKVNRNIETNIEKAALMIFLNKTCFNGLYRVNAKGLFNVPAGKYKNPVICDEANLRRISEKLQGVTIVCGSYLDSENFIDKDTFVYLDPPYRPLTDTASFTAYSENAFGDEQQKQLADYYRRLCHKGSVCLLSNSDPKNTNVDDNFFDELYKDFYINRVEANRMINCDGLSRGKITELLICNRA